MAIRSSTLFNLLTGVMRQDRGQVSRFLDSLDSATTARLTAAAEAGDNRTVMDAMSKAPIWGGRPRAAASAAAGGGRDPVPFEDRIAQDASIHGFFKENALPDDIMEQYRSGDITGAYARAVDWMDSTPAVSSAAESRLDGVEGESRALIPYGTGGPGVPVGGVGGPGVPVSPGTEMIPSPPRRIGGQTRAVTRGPGALGPAGGRSTPVIDARPLPDLPDADGLPGGSRPNLPETQGKPRGSWLPYAAAGAAAAGYGLSRLLSDDDLDASAAPLGADPDLRSGQGGKWMSMSDGYSDLPAAGVGGRVPPSRTVTVDGLTLPSVIGSDGQPLGDGQYYRERDRRNAERALAESIRQAGGDHGVPGPRTDDGQNPTAPPTFETAEEAKQYFTRPTNPMTGRLMPSQADLAMRARGFEVAFTPEGGTSYQLAAPPPEATTVADPRNFDKTGGSRSTEHERYAGFLAGTAANTGETILPKFQSQTVNGPFGQVNVLVPTDATRKENILRQTRLADIKRAASTGVFHDGFLESLSPKEAAMLAYERKQQKLKDRWAAKAYLAGGSQNIGPHNSNMLNALVALDGRDPQDLDAQEQVLMQNMPINNNRALIEAQNSANVFPVVRSALAGAAANLLKDPDEQEMRKRLLDAQERKQGAGDFDLRKGDWRSPDALARLDELAELHDSGGIGTMSWEDEDRLAGTLRNTYGLPQPEAEAAAHHAAEGRRLGPAKGHSRNPSVMESAIRESVGAAATAANPLAGLLQILNQFN